MRCAIVADIHGNLDALRCVLADAGARGATDQLWCLGDLVGYGPEPNECIREVRAHPHLLCLAGNHDWAAIGKIDSSEFNQDAAAAIRWTQERLEPELRLFLASLPTVLVAADLTLVHGSPRDHVREYITHAALARLNFDYFATPYCLVGHLHQPLVFVQPSKTRPVPSLPRGRLGPLAIETLVPGPGQELALGLDRLIVNPGSVGQPRDGNPDAAYMIYDDLERTLTLHRVPYPIAAAQRKMEMAGLPERLAKRLTYGW